MAIRQKPKYKIGDKVLCISDMEIGVIKKIDNKCSKLYNIYYDNPRYYEYYIKWKGAWTRHYVHELDKGKATTSSDKLIPLTKAAKVLYGK